MKTLKEDTEGKKRDRELRDIEKEEAGRNKKLQAIS